MSDVTLASLLVRIGADASSYMTTTSRVRTQTAQTFGALRGISRGFVDELSAAFGKALPASVQQAAKSMEYFGIAAQTMGKNLKWTSDVAKFSGGQIASFAEAAFRAGLVAGEAMKPWVEQLTGLQKATADMGSAQQEWIAALSGDAARFEEVLGLYDRMRTKLGLLSEDWVVQARHTDTNAARLAILQTRLQDYIAQVVKAPKAHDDFTEAALKAGNAIRKQQDSFAVGEKAVDGLIGRLKEMNDVTTSQDPVTALRDLLEQFKLLAASGDVSLQQLLTSFQSKALALDQEAAKLGVSLPLPIKEFVSSLQGPGAGLTVLDWFVKKVKEELPDGAAIAEAALVSKFAGVSGAIRDAHGELDSLGKALEKFTQDVHVKVVFEPDYSQLEAARHNLENPNVAGRVP